MRILVSILLAVLVSSCTSVSTQPRPESYYYNTNFSDDSGDLFGTGELLSDADIERILSYRLKLPAQNRIAVLDLSGNNYVNRYSGITQLSEASAHSLIEKLMASNKVYDASFLPRLLVPESQTVPYLREAAARYQADLLLVFRSLCQTYENTRFLKGDETKAYCSVEAALLDIRKGIVPFTSVSASDVEMTENSADMSFNETMRKAEIEAVSTSLNNIATDLTSFLANL